nr:hypothetical protein CFP56_28596 [Quercus suber]
MTMLSRQKKSTAMTPRASQQPRESGHPGARRPRHACVHSDRCRRSRISTLHQHNPSAPLVLFPPPSRARRAVLLLSVLALRNVTPHRWCMRHGSFYMQPTSQTRPRGHETMARGAASWKIHGNTCEVDRWAIKRHRNRNAGACAQICLGDPVRGPGAEQVARAHMHRFAPRVFTAHLAPGDLPIPLRTSPGIPCARLLIMTVHRTPGRQSWVGFCDAPQSHTLSRKFRAKILPRPAFIHARVKTTPVSNPGSADGSVVVLRKPEEVQAPRARVRCGAAGDHMHCKESNEVRQVSFLLGQLTLHRRTQPSLGSTSRPVRVSITASPTTTARGILCGPSYPYKYRIFILHLVI